MTTLRRELRKIAGQILKDRIAELLYDRDSGVFAFDMDKFISSLVEEVLDALNSNPKIDLSKTDPAWAILAGESADNAEAILAKEALLRFESDLQLPGNWQWYPAKTSEDSAWKLLREFVVEKFKEDKSCFQKYQTWRTQPFARGAMSNLAIKRNPENFPASWTDFLASNATYGKPAPERTVDVDDNGAVISY